MASENQVTIVGNLTDDPELRYTPNGAAVANFSVAVSRRAKDDATVSMPIEWKLMAGGISPTAFTIGGKETSKMLGQPDPWKDFFKAAKPLQR